MERVWVRAEGVFGAPSGACRRSFGALTPVAGTEKHRVVQPQIPGVRACVFDAYGTLFDVTAAASHCREELGDLWHPLADLWRTKQLQYTWLRSLMARHEDF